MRSDLSQRPRWLSLPFDWQSELATNQIRRTLHRQPLQFDKAAKAILLLEVLASTKERSEQSEITDSIYNYVRIEPAVYYLDLFTTDTLDELRERNILSILRNECGQETDQVFQDLANNGTVTFPLINKIDNVLRERVPNLSVGEITVATREHRRRTSTHEQIALVDPNEPWPNR
jgi:hypothetical protein